MELPVQLQENIISNSTIEGLKGLRSTSKTLKILADKEIKKRYLKIHRADELYTPVSASEIGPMLEYLTRLENEVVNPAIAAGPNMSQAQRDFLSSEIQWARDYPTLRYLLERGANPEEGAVELIQNYNLLVDSRQRHDPELIVQSALMVALALKYGLIIPTSYEARYVLSHIHDIYGERNLPLPAWVPANPNNWPEPIYFDMF